MNIFVTGGAGFVGRHLIERLVRDGHRVYSMLAPFEAAAWNDLRDLGSGSVVADILDRDDTVEALPWGTDAVFHLVGALTETRRLKFKDIHERATRNMLDACAEKGVKRFVFVSALGAAPDAKSANHRSKWAAEEMVRASGTGYTIVRPTIIFGKGDRFTNLFAYEIRNHHLIPMPDGGRNRVQPIYAGDLAEAMARALKMDETKGRAYGLGGHEIFTFRQMIERIYDVVGMRRTILPVPVPLMYLAGWAMETLMERPRLTRDLARMLTLDYVAEGNAITEVFRVRPTGFVEGMRHYLAPEEGPRKAA